MQDQTYTYDKLIQIIEQLRGENGCPWDKVQTHSSLVPHLLEESYELVDAINHQDTLNMKEELGDVLLQILLHAQIGKEENVFTIDQVIDGLARKLIYRHPHVFKAEKDIKTPEEVIVSWEELKKKEKKETSVSSSIDRIAKALPALVRTQKVQKKVAKVGFFWDSYLPIIDKVIEELEETKSAIKNGNKIQIEEELGDLLFSVVNLSTFFDLNPEFALTKSLEKFINRFRYIENSAFAQGKQLVDLSLEEINNLWETYKLSE
ncbi:nucleoside triphosphate pyrophosphohydrolase [Cellulosilyticum sp. I15G10I2]|uniref:nucleoside triphosphate pyrophosphohydrolase n=1 Tax=Cellulosilyticum sp. I15G10I2 TaxID=1892843 RepID=UPI00085C2109|nr:nucleoside triphosphate pyrophosphohydrolase [Cellulosilyticum sp. I15G10I2]